MNKILVIDDEALNLVTLGEMLSDKYDVSVANSAAKGMSILAKNQDKIDLILLDIIMPGVDGFEFCKVVKDDADTKDIPIILISTLNDTNFKIKGFSLGAVDYITKPFQREEVLARVDSHVKLFSLQKDLLKIVDEKTQEIIQKDKILIHNAKMSEMGEMIGAIAHQLKQPLNTISATTMLTEMLLDMGDSSGAKTNINKINDSVQFMASTIDEFRDLYKDDNLKKDFSIIKSIESIELILSHQFQVSGITISKDIDSSLKLYDNETQFKQIILNLFNNAKDVLIEKKVADGEIKVKVYTDENKKIIISVGDNGGGIPKENIDKIFNPYFTTKSSSGGTGIGLHIIKNIIEKNMDGNISVENTLNGAIFTIVLPT